MAKRAGKSDASQKDPATAYARGVVSGAVVTGRLVRLACERHLRDLEEGPARGLSWDLAAAARAVSFFATVLCLNGGEHEGRPFILQPWQAFIIGSLFGWKGSDGFRRFRTAYIEIGKGNGKSPLAAGVGLYCLAADDEPRAEVYAAATKRDQAMILFRDAVAMVDQSPALARRLSKSGAKGKEWDLAYHHTGSFFRAIGSDKDSQSGPRPHCGLVDEIHEHKSPIVVDMMRAGTKGRRQALIFEITNSGVDRESVCWHHHEYSAKVMEGHPDDSWFAFVCQLDACEKCRREGLNQPKDGCAACDDWRNEEVWAKANPNLGVSITLKYLREQVREAAGMPSKAGVVRRLNFCVWTETITAAIPMDLWDLCGRLDGASDPADWRRRTIERLEHRPCKAGLDLGSTADLTALGLLFAEEDEETGEEAYTILPYFWVPAAAARKRSEADKVDYFRWISEGFVLSTPGNTTDYARVRADLADIAGQFSVPEIAVDRLFQGRNSVPSWRKMGLRSSASGKGFSAWPPR